MDYQTLSTIFDAPANGRILCVGTTPAVERVMCFDGLNPGQVNRAAQVLQAPAGKATNVAKVVHDLHGQAVVFSVVGGSTGAYLRQQLQASGIACELVESMHPTRICVTVMNRQPHSVTELVEESPPVTNAELIELRNRLERWLPQAAVLVLSGSLAPGVPVDFYQQCVALARSAGVKTIVDARAEPLKQALEAGPNLIKPNLEELAATVGRSLESEAERRQALKSLLHCPDRWSAVTAGAEAVLVWDGSRFWKIHPPRIEVVNPIGSGDAFAGGAAVALARGVPMPQAIAFAMACGGANALQIEPGRVRAEDVRALAENIELEPLQE